MNINLDISFLRFSVPCISEPPVIALVWLHEQVELGRRRLKPDEILNTQAGRVRVRCPGRFFQKITNPTQI